MINGNFYLGKGLMMKTRKTYLIPAIFAFFSWSIFASGKDKLFSTIPDEDFTVPFSREFELNNNIKPCNDFYSYVCSIENSKFKLPESKSRYIYSFHDPAERIKKQRFLYIKNLVNIRMLSKRQEMIHHYYQSCINVQARQIDENNYLADFRTILLLSNKDELLKKFASNTISGKFNLIEIFEFVNKSDSKVKDVMFYYSLPFEAKEYYFDEKLLYDYENIVAKFLKLFNTSSIKNKAKFIVNFEKSIAKIYPNNSELREFFAKDSSIQRNFLIKEYPELHFELMLEKIPENVNINSIYSNVLTELNKQLKMATLDELKALYLWSNFGFKDLKFSHKDFYDKTKKFNNKYFGSPTVDEPLEQQCVKDTVVAMGRILDYEVINEYYKDIPEERIQKMVQNIQSTTLKSIESNTWLSKYAKEKAVEKIKTMRFQIVKPKKIQDWDFENELNLFQDKFLTNQKLLAESKFKKFLEEVTEPVNANEWKMSPLTVNAYYVPTANQFVLPIGILQPPFFNAQKPDFVNLGSMGMVVAHEIGHAIDDQGSKYDETGKLNHWMNKNDLANFKSKTEKLVTIFNNEGINGQLTLGENIADYVGVKNAFQTAFPENFPADIQQQKEFFIQFARVWCGVTQPKEQEHLLKINTHSPQEARVNIQAKLSPEFEKTFSCKKKDPMVFLEDKRISLW